MILKYWLKVIRHYSKKIPWKIFVSEEFERVFPKILKKPGLFQISFEKARKSPAKKPGLFWAGLFTLANPAWGLFLTWGLFFTCGLFFTLGIFHPKQNTRKDHYESHLLKSRQILKNVQKFYFNSIFAEFRNDLDFGKLLSNIIGWSVYWKL